MATKYVGATALQETITKTKEFLGEKVDKVQGKGLSTNDYTSAEKSKLAGIEAGAQVNLLEGVQVNGSDLPIASKKVNIDLSSFITKNVSDLVNYYKKSETYTQAEVNALIGALKTISIEVVTSLPATGESNIIYLIKHSHDTDDLYDEYLWVAKESKYEKIGNTDIDLSRYATIEAMNTAISTALASYYTKGEMDTALGLKADASALAGYVPTSRKVNGHVLTEDITITASNVGAYSTTEVDTKLADYVKTSDLVAITASEVDAMWE